ncbi:MAG: DUF885 domain-containing protein [Candidatus Marinimicrobia bacterium]|nr:DUF885 domain-containing protein [Candidatus Neomarinimicrobiota bacterium]
MAKRAESCAKGRLVVAITLLLVLTTCQRGSRQWDQFVEKFIDGFARQHPVWAVSTGLHQFDGQLPDFSLVALQTEVVWLRAQQRLVENFDGASLSEPQRREREYALAVIAGQLFWLETAGWPLKNPSYYAGALSPDVYVNREYAPLDQRLRAYVAYARNVPEAVEHVRLNLRVPLPKTYVQLGRIQFGGLARFLTEDIPGIFAPVEDEALQAEFRAANDAAIEAFRDLDAWFGRQEATATDDYALGSEVFSEMLRVTQQVDVSLDSLEAIGRRDLERNLAALEQACAELAPGQSIPDCIAWVQGHKPEEGPVQAARNQLAGLRQLLIDQELVTIPGTEGALVDESPPHRRWNAAYIDIPGPYEEGLPSTYYIAPPDPSWSDEEQRAYIPGEADLLFISVHEVWPGHFLQFLHANRSSSKFGQLFSTYSFTEGWAHYTEELMWEAGLNDGDPATHIGQLLNALLRNVRYLSAIGLHTQGMTVAESEKMFRELAHQDPGNARQQAARGTFDPGYLNYTLGKLMIRRLRADWTASRGGREAWGAFHDAFLSYGSPPVPLVRKAMLGEDSGPAL